MKKLMILAALFIGFQAQADGFICQTIENDLRIAVYNHTNPNAGTRNAAIMILSAPDADLGARTVAKFSSVEGSLTNYGAQYTAVNSTVFGQPGSDRPVAGTRLGLVDDVTLRIQYVYGNHVEPGSRLEGKLYVNASSGLIKRDVICARYLKN